MAFKRPNLCVFLFIYSQIRVKTSIPCKDQSANLSVGGGEELQLVLPQPEIYFPLRHKMIRNRLISHTSDRSCFPHYGERLRFIHGQSHIHHPAAVKTLQSIEFDLICSRTRWNVYWKCRPNILMNWKSILSEGFVGMDEKLSPVLV